MDGERGLETEDAGFGERRLLAVRPFEDLRPGSDSGWLTRGLLSDLAALLASFGLSAGDPGFEPAADFNRDNMVDLSDLAALLAVYGT